MDEIIIHDEVSKARAVDFISRLSIDLKWRVAVARYRQKRSGQQNKTIHLWFGEMAVKGGTTAEIVKEDAIELFCPTVINPITGNVVKKRTSQLDTAEMTEFMARVYAWACEFGILVSHPDERGR